MNEFWTVLGAVLPVFCVTGVGALMRKLNWLTEEADHSLLRVTINVLVPCLIFDSTSSNAALHRVSNVTIAPLIGFLTVVLGIFLAWIFRKASGLNEIRQQRTFAVSTGIYNYGYVPIPLILLLFGQETVGVLFVHNVGVEIALWTVGLILMSGASPGSEWHKIFNPPLIAVVVGLGFNLTGATSYIPGFLVTTIKMLGQCAIPMGIVLIGATIADQIHEFHSDSAWQVLGMGCLFRLGVFPFLFVLAAKYCPLSLELKRIMVVQASMPAAVFPIVMAKHYGGDTATALRVVISTSALSLITTPLWIRFGVKWIGLY